MLTWRTPPPYDTSYASSAQRGLEYAIDRVRRGQKRVRLRVLTVRPGTPFHDAADQGEFKDADAAKEYAEKYEAAVIRNRVEENPISRTTGLALLGVGAVLSVAALLWTSTKNKTPLKANTYPVTQGASYTVSIKSTLDPTQWNSPFAQFFPGGTLAETGIANEWELQGVAAQSGNVTDNPPNWTIRGWTEQGAPSA